jgi:serpin B
MASAGAAGTTAAEMTSVLHSTALGQRLHPSVGRLLEALDRRGGAGHPRLEVANGVWVERSVAFRPPFLDVLSDAYGSALHLADFKGQAPGARAEINDWVAGQTSNMIRELLGPGAVHALTAIVVLSAIYLGASWRAPFDPAATVEAAFTLLSGNEVAVPMMRCVQRLAYVRRAGYQAVELPYVGEALSMVVILPDAGHFEEVEARLDAPALAKALRSLMPCEVVLGLPRFMLSAQIELAPVLAGLGMVEAFSERDANFSAATAKTIWISVVPHEARIDVDERGTRAAAAATAVVMSRKAGPAQMIADRPFLFAVRDRGTSALLFLGRVLDPVA